MMPKARRGRKRQAGARARPERPARDFFSLEALNIGAFDAILMGIEEVMPRQAFPPPVTGASAGCRAGKAGRITGSNTRQPLQRAGEPHRNSRPDPVHATGRADQLRGRKVTSSVIAMWLTQSETRLPTVRPWGRWSGFNESVAGDAGQILQDATCEWRLADNQEARHPEKATSSYKSPGSLAALAGARDWISRSINRTPR